jgi:hypothetical protein
MRFFLTFGAGWTSLLCCYVGVVSIQLIDIVQRSLPEPELVVLEAVEQIDAALSRDRNLDLRWVCALVEAAEQHQMLD